MNKRRLFYLLLVLIFSLCGCSKTVDSSTTDDISVSLENTSTLKCTLLIECSTIFNNLDLLEEGKLEVVPENGIILETTEIEFEEGESVFDVLQRACREQKIHMEASFTPVYDSAYVEGISNLYEFDCGSLSGWMYSVNGVFPNYGSSRYLLLDGDVVEWKYSCDLGADIGGGNSVADE